ncbi:hypothetical protein SAMN06295967_1185 [Belliella buryatensis]|uniref:Uncharacterized protein n=1 Tax=Belliella buryatensis TaxID=1500549 RepID=A0A239GNB4_9BACT|nr:hypothetical protein [Belliella buryatensis]SNS70657.1 hypothetical protein SAMN06295967_1185 [Belliella buryatensis]
MDLLIEVTNTPVIECLLLLLLTGDNGKIDWTNNLIKDYRLQFMELKEKSEATEFINLVIQSNLEKEVLEDKSLTHLHIRLEKQKRKLLKTYFTSIKQEKEFLDEYEYVGDFNSLISKYFLQMKRLQLVIQPDVQIATSVHSKSKITYLTARGFWLNDKGERERKYVKSLGRLDEFDGGKKDPLVIKLGIEKIREESLKDYNQRYPD